MTILLIILGIILIAGVIIFFFIRKKNNDKKAEEEVKKKAEEEARKKAEEEAKKKAEEEAKKKAEEEARKKAEEEARKKAEEEARKKAEEEAKKKAEEEAKKKAEEAKTKKFEEYLNKFGFDISKESSIYKYFRKLYNEAYSQFYNKSSLNNIPTLIKEDNFPHLYEFGKLENLDMAFETLIGWLFALQFTELKPFEKTNILKIGYELGGYNKYSNIYGYTFESDPNIMRKVAGVIYAAMRGTIKPNVDDFRQEINGNKFKDSFETLLDQKRDKVGDKDFYIDLREFMPTAPGPYASSYTERPDNTYPNELKDEYNNLQIDRDIHEDIITKYNLDNAEYKQETVQAIADKEADNGHMFGPNRSTVNYSFHPIFGNDTIGIEISDSGDVAYLASLCFMASSSARGILQSANVNPKQYGRLRPGCSWTKEATPNSTKEDNRNVLTDFEIEDGDGSPTGYYDKKGNWVYKDAISSPKDFEKSAKKSLWANSYPSGHSSGIFGASMLLIELMPEKSDMILKEANQYAINRTIARYHWTSDTRNGRVLGSAMNAVLHAANNFDDLLNKAKEEIKK